MTEDRDTGGDERTWLVQGQMRALELHDDLVLVFWRKDKVDQEFHMDQAKSHWRLLHEAMKALGIAE